MILSDFMKQRKIENSKNPKTEKSKTLFIIEAEYYRLNQDSQRGIIGNEEKELRANQINNKLLILLEAAPKELDQSKPIKKFLLPSLLIVSLFP